MASIRKVGDKWLARVRRKGYPEQSRVFISKILAEKWARQVETEVDAGRAGQAAPGHVLMGALIDRYTEEIGAKNPFGRNKEATLKLIRSHLKNEPAGTLTAERLVRYIVKDRKIDGVTAAIDLAYLKGVLKVARALWKLGVQPSVVDETREILKHMGMASRSNERDRRPTADELERLKRWFAQRSETLTPDHLEFILDSCFRPPSEITRLRWDDLHHEDRTILIRDRKDPRRKLGNNQTVPLLGRCYEIVMRQPREPGQEVIFPVNGKSWSSLFPRACAALGIIDLQLYDLRHEAISRLVESGKYSAQGPEAADAVHPAARAGPTSLSPQCKNPRPPFGAGE
ncbi:MAG: site-specific integrase [Ramlibacter sp.]